MVNSTHFTTVILTGYFEVGQTNYIYFALLTILYITIRLANSIVIDVIYVERSLHDPMYIFICCFCINKLYGSVAFSPFILTINHLHEVTIASCYVQIFCTHASVEFGSLAVMFYDRYMAVILYYIAV